MIRNLGAILAAIGWLGAVGEARALDAPVTVAVESGQVIGRSDGAVDIFKGVPFAAAPVGRLRWAPPQRAPAWHEPRDASAFGPACPQTVDPAGKPNLGGYVGPISEDCLNLNVFAPHGARNAPVMVWIYGGGDVAGANAVPSNDGASFARDGVVLVSINYRLGALGYFAHPALSRAARRDEPLANYGTMDQIAALTWIRRNIKAFGGDPNNVTIFGESAGGMNVLTLMATPAARGLFQKASVESGGGWESPSDLAEGEAAGAALARAWGLPANASVEALRALPLERLLSAPGRFGPIVDGRLIKESYAQAFVRGDQAHVPMIIGSNDFEASLLPAGAAADFLAKFPQSTRQAYVSEAGGGDSLAQALFTDAFGGAPARWIARESSKIAPTWLYQFTYVRVVRRGKIAGANHTSEIPYVFDSQMAVPVYRLEIKDEDRAMARRVHSCWVAFAKAGAPTCDGGPAWPTYDRDADQLLLFGRTLEVRSHWRKSELDAIETTPGIGPPQP